ncbi:FHA domain-containing protein [Haliangium ochraceum]|uniref:FHA domain containing protein n=1 Tax=Haliangium ochraceum (strain DSM 14365 / JCM 11303 / SMP-2) TaxID=502025 RepID=D0LVZ5_HALO1|nr:FHA domain-containing protein [Haliangium ochraceum]ACY14129.1 FHA domain containing protein [Haliangium ochraceum DSM 14365]
MTEPAATVSDLVADIRRGKRLTSCIFIDASAQLENLWRGHERSQAQDFVTGITSNFGDCEYLVGMGPSSRTITIGRSRRCDLQLRDPSIGKLYASLFFDRERGSFCLVDERSVNGTFVAGEQLVPGTPRALWDGCVVGIGLRVLVFVTASTMNQLALG